MSARQTRPAREPQPDSHPSDNSPDVSEVLSSSVAGASYLVLLQLGSRLLTFALHQIVLRFTTAETLGVASVKLELLLSSILFLSREGFRCALLRSGGESTFTATDGNASALDATLLPSTRGVLVTSKQGQTQKIVNLAYLPTVIGLATTFVACAYYLSTVDAEAARAYPYYRTSIILFGLAAYFELLSEPLFILAQNNLYFKLRVSVEGTGVLLRCFVTFGLTMLGAARPNKDGQNSYGVFAFALAQLVFGLTMVLGYAGFFGWKAKKGKIDLRNLVPQRLMEVKQDKVRTFWFDPYLLNLATTMTKQSLLKHLLTEGDKMLVSALSSARDQGVYAFVVNYGSLIARILFQPLEETGRTLFSKLLADINNPSSSPTSSTSTTTSSTTHPITAVQHKTLLTSATLLLTLLQFHILLGLLFIGLATNYTGTLIDLLVGPKWSIAEPAPLVLSVYCGYVPVMGLNGITEAFVQAVASEHDLGRLSRAMIGFSLGFVAAGYLFMSVLEWGAVGLVIANNINLGLRIGYSWWYIRKYYLTDRGHDLTEMRKIVSVRNWWPSGIVMAVFAAAWGVTWWSEKIIGWATLGAKAKHIGVGAVCGLAVLAVV
ncbi:Rft protein-domain-containing protein [Endogone sp. FLAS-F59071]|nr:Rft protein-domain-containing protein [Endogone sp. FLAS-F59071]|eukprot:RUS15442.1 Rft protein-domain-containing protein [Endogone sp. FLAS-F59071]